jgi:hypothetical protein
VAWDSLIFGISDPLLVFFVELTEPLQPHHIPPERNKPWPICQIERVARMYYASVATKTQADSITQQIRQFWKHAFGFAMMHLNRPTNTPAHLTGVLVTQSAGFRPFP